MEIRKRVAAGAVRKDVAADFDVSVAYVSSLCNGYSWRQLPYWPTAYSRRYHPNYAGPNPPPCEARGGSHATGE